MYIYIYMLLKKTRYFSSTPISAFAGHHCVAPTKILC